MSTMVNEKIIDKVKKLLALSSSPSEEEANSALLKAKKMLSDYNLSMSDIETAPEKTDIAIETMENGAAVRQWKLSIGNSIAKFYFCTVLLIPGRGSVIIGKPDNRATALEMYKYITETVVKTAKAAGKKERKETEDFIVGMSMRIVKRIHDMTLSETVSTTALTICYKAENDKFISDTFGKVKTKQTKPQIQTNAFMQGYKAGENVSLNRQIAQ